MKSRNYFFLLLQCVTLQIFAQDIFPPSLISPSIKAKHIEDVIMIDGVLNEDIWQTSDSLHDFIQIEPHQGMLAKNRTIVKILYSNKFLYVGVFCFDSLGKSAIRAQDLKRDFNWRAHDTFAICIDGFNDKRNSISFVTNPYGAQKDYLSFDDVLFDGDWNGLWKVRTSITNEGWFAEFQIPWKTMRYPKLEDGMRSWGINFLRLRRESNEISVWSPYPRSLGFNRMEYAGAVEEIVPPPPSTNIQVNPYSLLSSNKNISSGQTQSHEYQLKVGGDVKWAINSNTIADLTINTDFAQADADVQVNNVSRFSVLFPEKRQFFLENASLFGPGLIANDDTGGNMQILPFFSRRIGLSNNGSALPLEGGIRLTNRSIKHNFGIMAVQQGSLDTLPSSYFSVGRYTRNFGKQNRIGVMGTMKSIDQGHTNLLGGIDGFFRFNTSHSLNFMVMESTNTNGTGQGLGGYAQYYYTTNKVTAWITETVLTKDFTPELGFLSRTDVISTSPGAVANLRGKYLPFKKHVRSYQPTVTANWFNQASTSKLTEREVKLTPFKIEMQNGGYYGFTLSYALQDLISDFNPLGIFIAKGRYTYNRYSLVAGSDPSSKISYSFQHEFGDYYNGSLQTTNFTISIIPIPHISLRGSINTNQFKNVGIELEKKQVTLYTIQGRLALNPRVQLVGLYQRNSQNNLNSYNVRFAWEYTPLSYIYLVLNSRESLNTDQTQQQERQGIIKLSYLKQF